MLRPLAVTRAGSHIGKRFASYTAVNKRTLKPYLFEFKVPLAYSKVVDTLTSCRDDKELPKKVTANDLMSLKRVLETYRKRTGSTVPENVMIERNLLERAAELGDSTAIAILCGDVLSNSEANEADKAHADSLLIQLMSQKFALSFKVSGDLAYKMGLKKEALKFYKQAAHIWETKSTNNVTELPNKTECLRSIGVLSFSAGDAVMAKKYFEKAVALSDDNTQVADCHYYLGQLYEYDKAKACYHFERAAMSSLKESFTPLGFLYLNYFNKPDLAYEWFNLGAQLGEESCFMGLFDCSMKKKDYVKAKSAALKLSKLENGNSFLASRQNTLRLLDEKLAINSPIEMVDPASEVKEPVSNNKPGRWEF